MNAIRSFFSWIADLFRSLFGGKQDDGEKPTLCGVKDWIIEDGSGSRYVVFLFRAEQFSGELTSSSEGQVFWMELEDVMKSNWMWNLDGILRIVADGDYSELFLDSADGWKAYLK